MVTQEQSRVANPDFVPGFDEACFQRLDGGREPALLGAARRDAFEAYRLMPSPTNRVEEWRRTDPARFPFGKLRVLPQPATGAAAKPGDWDQAFDAVVTVKDGGVAVADVSGAVKSGKVIAMPLAEAAARHPDLVGEYLRTRARRAKQGKFDVLNEAFWNVGVFVHVPARVELERGVLIRYEHATAGSILVPRAIVVIGERSRATVMEHLVSPDGALLMDVMLKEFHVGPAARLKVLSLQEWGNNTYHLVSDWAFAAREAQIEWITLNFGGKLGKMSFASDVMGEGASAELDGLYFAAGDQHFDQKTLQVHSAPNTYSRLLYKGAVKDKAYSVYQGLIIARRGAVKVDAYQRNNNLVLSDGARADSLPGLEIDADDLKCSHGSTIGNLDPEQLFYLRTRGFNEAEARRTLIQAFFEEVAGRIPYEFVRERVYEHIEAGIG